VYTRHVLSRDPVTKNFESCDQSRQVTSSKWPVYLRKSANGANSLVAAGVRHMWICRLCVTAMKRPHGLNLASSTLVLKLNRCRSARRAKLTRSARPSSSIIIIRTPSGERTIFSTSLLHSNGNVKDVLVTRLKQETLLPTGLRMLLPSGVNTRFPWLYTVPYRFENL